MKLSVFVRKRPLFEKEGREGQIDCVSVANPIIRVSEPRYKVDGITKFIENHDTKFDNVFAGSETADVYNYSIKPLLANLFAGGIVTCFAYGQTGSGKTFTMVGIQNMAIRDMFR